MRAAASKSLSSVGVRHTRSARVATAVVQGGWHRQLHTSNKGAQKRPGKASLVTETHHTRRTPPVNVGNINPSTLDSARGRIKLSGSSLQGYYSESDDARWRNMAPPALNGPVKLTGAQLEKTKSDIIEYFHQTYTLFERLHEVFSDTPAFYEKHERLRHPPIFYMGHTAAFYINKLHLGRFIPERIDPVLEMQMAVGVDEMSWDDLDSNSYVWASGEEAREDPNTATSFLQRVLDFRFQVRQLVDARMKEEPMKWPITTDSFWYVIMMCIEHDRIHLETSSVILRQAKMQCIQPSAYFPTCENGRFHVDIGSVAAKSMPPNRLIPVEHGSTRVGRSWADTKTYGWDNEFGKVQHLEVPAFKASEFLVSNYEFYRFVEDGGYSQRPFWTEEGWNWVTDMKPEAPRFWIRRDNGHYLRTLCDEIAMPWDWPVEVNHHEAAAFCKYLSEKTGKNLRLPMEDEYLRIRDGVTTDIQDSAHGPAWGSQAPGNVNLAYWGSSCPVDMFRSPSGICDVLGNVWQHNLTNIDVLEGFTSHPLYDDFTTPTVCGKHSRIMGGSWISSGANGGTRDSRFGFRRHFYQHAGFRYIETDREVVNEVLPYERDRYLCDAFRFHFDEPELAVGNFHTKLADACTQTLARLGMPLQGRRALELGCGPGRTVLELAKRGAAVVHGGDRTAKAFQLVAQHLLGPAQRLRWINFRESELVEPRQLTAEEVGFGKHDGCQENIQFYQFPDYAVIDTKKFSDYDLVVCAQPGMLGGSDPVGLLNALHKVLKPGGILAIGTQYEWSIPGIVGTSSGEEVLAKVLFSWFEPVAKPVDLPFAISRSARKFECGTQHVTFWRRLPEKRKGEALEVDTSQMSREHDDDGALWKYMDSHYGPYSTYPAACARRCAEAVERLGVPFGRALEVGSGPGRAAVELSRAFKHVDSGDLSASFVEMAQRLLKEGEICWNMPADQTGGRTVQRAVSAKELSPGSVNFMCLDAEALPKYLTGYDLICGFSLLDQLARPRDFLLGAKERLNKGGLLVLSSPYEWSEELTDKDQWLGGFKYGDNDGPSTYQGLKELLLAEGFEEALPPEELEFDLDEQADGRKSQRVRTQMTFWRLW